MATINFNLRDLRYLVALADKRHFGRAAEASFVSQPTLSAQLKKLEDSLGVLLIERGRQVRLTPVGEDIAERARRVLREVDDLADTARRHRDPLAGPLEVGFIPTLGPYLLPHIVPAIRRRYPQLNLLLREEQTHRLLESLRTGRLDAAVLALPVDTHGLETMDLFVEPFTVALPPQHPLAAKGTLEIADLENQTLLLLEEGHCLREQALDVCRAVNAREREDFRGTSLETLRYMVASGAGITLLPLLAAARSDPSVVAVRPFAAPAPFRTVGVAWRKASARRAAIEALGDAIRDAMAGVMGKDSAKAETTTAVPG